MAILNPDFWPTIRKATTFIVGILLFFTVFIACVTLNVPEFWTDILAILIFVPLTLFLAWQSPTRLEDISSIRSGNTDHADVDSEPNCPSMCQMCGGGDIETRGLILHWSGWDTVKNQKCGGGQTYGVCRRCGSFHSYLTCPREDGTSRITQYVPTQEEWDQDVEREGNPFRRGDHSAFRQTATESPREM